jgi:nitrogen fixation NifU-like protein
MSDLDELYQGIILDHNKRPRNYGILDDRTHRADGFNPLCGDKVQVYLRIVDERIEKVQFEAASCAICMASASIMTQELVGKTLEEAQEVESRVEVLLREEVDPAELESDLIALQGVRKFPARVKCALLPWGTFRDAYRSGEEPEKE